MREYIIIGCWATFVVVWAISAFNVKRDISRGHGDVWQKLWPVRLLGAAGAVIFVAARILTGTAHFTKAGLVFVQSLFPQSATLGWAAAACSVAGLSVAIWARVNLGRNWSSHPAVKEHHELVTSGPYAYVRHPIYTGAMLMAFGTATTGSIWGIGVFIVSALVYIPRIGKEEKIMLELFPEQYPEYRKKTKALIPWIL
jgi:protein-S-isoprenylcysteine O-methyltransferase Ste14